MRKLKKLLLILIIAVLVCGINTVNYASTLDEVLSDTAINNKNSTNNGTNNTNTNNTNTNANSNKNTNTNTNTNINTNASKNTNTNSSLPKTGADDTAMWIIAVSCVGVAIYTYKKIRDYNV